MSNLKEKIEEGIKVYEENNKEVEKEVRKIIQKYVENRSAFEHYKPEFRTQEFRNAVNKQIKPILESEEETNILINKKIKEIIQEEKNNVIPKPKEKPADYAVRISNALKYLEIEGKDLTDETAYEILKDFIDDYEQMKLFKNVILKHISVSGFENAEGKCNFPKKFENAEGKCNFPKTFEKFNKIEMLLNTFNEIEAIANTLFLSDKKLTERFVFYNARIELPLATRRPISDEDEILKLAGIIDNEINKMNNLAFDKNEVHITE